MLFHITQTHTPEQCPRDVGGSSILYDAKAPGAKLLAMYGAFAEHTIYYIVEADDLGAVQHFLDPGVLRCTSKITPVFSTPLTKPQATRRRAKAK